MGFASDTPTFGDIELYVPHAASRSNTEDSMVHGSDKWEGMY